MAARCSPVGVPRVVPASARDLTSESDTPGSRFPREARLTHPREYQAVFAGAKRLGDRYFTVLVIPNDIARPRLGLAVSRKAAPRSVDRNRIKRAARESFRHVQHSLPGLDIVVIAKAGARDAECAVLQHSLNHQWQRLLRR